MTGVRELARGPRRRTHETVRGFFPASEAVRARLAVHVALGRLGGRRPARLAVRWRELDGRLWEIDWRDHFQPVRAGRRLVIVPPWDRTPVGRRVRVVIHPGMAFGTGQHPTTATCLEVLERLATPPPARALDVGTGSGVLAIALAKLGVRRVLALDVDPQAITAARDNLRRNRLSVRVALRCATLDEAWARRPAHRGAYPLVVANLYADVLAALAPAFASVTRPGGHLVTSGILRPQQARLRAAFAPPAWRVRGTVRRGSWVTTVFERVAEPER